jgi:sialate O-acetylesterase
MVLQRDVAAPVWGTAQPGQPITVTIGQQKKTATADKDGNWMLKLDALPAGGPLEMTIEGQAKLTLKDVLVGEVWLCSGQSNMQWPVSRATNGAQEVAEANYPAIRLLQGVDSPWVDCNPKSVRWFSAVGYFFGRDLHKALNVPIGLINESVGGTSARWWTPPETIQAHPELKGAITDYEKEKVDLPKDQANYQKNLERWQAATQSAGTQPSATQAAQLRQMKPITPVLHPPGYLYDSMIRPVAPYAIRGAIWYQGESDAGRLTEYDFLFPTLIRSWRSAWGQGDFPFLFVQLPNYESDWSKLREIQTHALALPGTGMAVTIDIGEANDIHPTNKQEVGRRLALVALAKAYGQKVVCSGPVYDSFAAEGGKARVKFKEIGGGLAAKGDKLSAFVVAGEDKKFVPAQAKIEGDSIVVWSDAVLQPAAVRYAWEANPACSLYNKEGLPAAPFRTDQW